MNAPRPAELARRLFGHVRRERPSAALRERILVAGRAELERARGVPLVDAWRGPDEAAGHTSERRHPERSTAARRWVVVAAFAAAAGLIAYVGAGRAPDSDVMISAEHAGAATLGRSSEPLGSGTPELQSGEHAASTRVEAAPARVTPVPAAPTADDATPSLARPFSRARDEAASRSDAKRSPQRADGSSPPPTRAAPEPKTAPRASLGEQLEQIKGVRAALRAGDPRRALELIEAYQVRGNGDELAAEASLLRIEALSMSGQKDVAAEAARQFASDYPNSPLIDRALSYAAKR